MSRFARQFAPIYSMIREDIFRFCEFMGFEPTWQQAEVLMLVQKGYKRIAVKSGQGPGKTTCSVIAGLWRTIQFVDALTVITAPTMRQAKRWVSECQRLLEKAPAQFRALVEVTTTKIRLAGRSNWGIDLVTATKSENAQGIHEDNLTVIVEEASGVSRDIIEQFEGTLTNENAMLFLIGNPNSRQTAFFDCFNRFRHKWKCVTLSTEDSTRITVNRSGREEPMVSPENILYLAEKYGVDSDVYRVRVKGEFPYSDPNCVLDSETLEKCLHTNPVKLATMGRPGGLPPAKQFGIDFARFGADESTWFRRVGNAIIDWGFFSKQEPARVVEHVFRKQTEAFWRDEDCWYVPDAGGMGQGVMHMFHDAGKNVLEFHNQGRADNTEEFDNKITEAWFHFAALAKAGHVYIPNDNRLFQQIVTRQYHTTKKGKLIIESKDEYMKRDDTEGLSPDRADGLVLAFYDQMLAPVRFARRAG